VIRLKVWDLRALFSRPEMKVERFSYDVITPSAARGILEAIHWKPQMVWRIQRLRVIAAIKPGHASIPNSILPLASSPYAKRGLLWTTFRKHFGRDDARVLVWKGSAAEMNPSLDPTVIAEAYEEDPASAAAEFGAEFGSDVEAVVSRETSTHAPCWALANCCRSGALTMPASWTRPAVLRTA
jgi:CRISPR-associated Cas5-like protein